MAVSVVMPALELAQETGKLISWRKKEGERVAKGEPLLEIETDKAVVEIESPGEGILAGVKAQEGAVIPVGETIAWILLPGESVPADSALAHPATQGGRKNQAAAGASTASGAAVAESSAAAVRISPKARRLAREHGIDPARVRGSGAEGEILASDIEALVEAGKESAAAPSLEPLTTAMRLMAERTTASWTSVPHFFVVRDAAAGALNAARERLSPAIEKSHGVRLTHTDLLIALAASTLKKHPGLNASWTAEGIRIHPEVNMGIAVAAKDAVAAAVIHNAHTASLGEIARQRRDLAERARAGRLRPADISGATFTISNLGMYHVDAFTAIIVPPQAAILAVGSIADRVVPVEGKPGVRPMMTLTLSCDHRAVEGARAAAFLDDLVQALLNPEFLQASNG
jgi:pyruvate dehydrogenase E2 component (dihydrolipoyllysine-residue acetyltransferase)